MTRAAAPRWRRFFALAACCAWRLAASAPTSAYGDAGSQGHSEAPFKLLSTTPGSGNGADDGKVTATPWDIVVLTLGCTVAFACCALGIRRLMLQSAKEKAAMDAALAAFGADRGDAAEDMEAGGAPGGAEDDAARRNRRRERRAARQAQAVELPAGDRQLPQRLPSRGRRGASSASAASRRIPAWPEDEDAALAASLADDVELVPMYTFTPVSGADGDWFVAPLAHLPDEAPRRPRRPRDREERPPQPPEAQKSFMGIPLPPGWG